MRATRALIHLENLRENIRILKQYLSPETAICMAVKADGYGHGAVRIVDTARKEGVGFFGVATVSEGREIREAGIDAPLLLFSLPLPEEIPAVVDYGMTPFIADTGMVDLLEAEAVRRNIRLDLHLKVDTGMGRIGCRPGETVGLCERITGSPHLRLAGLCTHFPGADCDDQEFTSSQIREFSRIVREVRSRGIDPGMIHAANSAGILRFPGAHFDMVRPGIVLYGYSPFPQDREILPVRPVMELESRIVFLKKVPAGFPVSYGMTYRTQAETVIGTVAAGYADGFPRSLSNRGRVLINGKTYPVAGRICMDQFMVDLGLDSDVRLHDRVTLFGPDAGGPSAQELADLTDTISYEITCGINKRVPRIYL